MVVIRLIVVERMAESVFVPLTVGGGVRKVEDIRLLLNAGADKVSINSTLCLTLSLYKKRFWRTMHCRCD